ncbi:hypothetical protein VTL71DRAFT_7539 [Oculimacula yallundae]|uniref:Uncharacterized protein n=1 Tax=Oculimacula yallundae TaxID=86028 RepID=A0ABR4BVK8_9HELO
MAHSHAIDSNAAAISDILTGPMQHMRHDQSAYTHQLPASEYNDQHHHHQHPQDEAVSSQSLLNTSDDSPPAYGTLLNVEQERARLKTRQRIEQRPNGPRLEDFGIGFMASLFCFMILGFILWLALQSG